MRCSSLAASQAPEITSQAATLAAPTLLALPFSDMKGASGRYGGHVAGPGNYNGPLIAHTVLVRLVEMHTQSGTWSLMGYASPVFLTRAYV